MVLKHAVKIELILIILANDIIAKKDLGLKTIRLAILAF